MSLLGVVMASAAVNAEPGRYLLTGYTSAGLRNGTLVVDLQEGSNINVYTVTTKATNSGLGGTHHP